MDFPNGHASGDAPSHHVNDRLDSWGEIALHLRRGIRTVRRWESEEGLPVYRHLHRKSGSVYAFKSELDAWWDNRRFQLGSPAAKSPSRWMSRHWGVVAIILVLGVVVGVWVRPVSSKRQKTPTSVQGLAVLPFDDLSVNPQYGRFADAMTEQLITSLAQVMPVRIASRNSVMPYKNSRKALQEIAQELNVDAVVTGSVQQVGQHVIITVRLIDARNDRHIWAASFGGVANDILDFQEKTAHTAANEIRAALKFGQRR